MANDSETVDDYDYHLPPELIAQQPQNVREDARLMVIDRLGDTFVHRHVRDLPELLSPDDCLVVNDTRVVPARLLGRRLTTGGKFEGLFLDANELGLWRLLGRTRSKLAVGEELLIEPPEGNAELRLRLLAREPGGVWVAMPLVDRPVVELLEAFGRVPLPCYIRRGQAVPADRQRYQTVYARHPGSAAAPTAGLHLSERLLAQIAERGVPVFRVTLHIGLDTFRPVKVHRLDEHPMHSEWGRLEAVTARALVERRQAGGRLIAVGTTTTRVLETAGLMSAQLGVEPLSGWMGHTDLFIRPPYEFRVIDGLLTNFHLPRSTLLMLVAALAGRERVLRAYSEAVAEGYRFYSYGDAMLVL